MLKKNGDCRETATRNSQPEGIFNVEVLAPGYRAENEEVFGDRFRPFLRCGFVNSLGKVECRLVTGNTLPKNEADVLLIP